MESLSAQNLNDNKAYQCNLQPLHNAAENANTLLKRAVTLRERTITAPSAKLMHEAEKLVKHIAAEAAKLKKSALTKAHEMNPDTKSFEFARFASFSNARFLGEYRAKIPEELLDKACAIFYKDTIWKREAYTATRIQESKPLYSTKLEKLISYVIKHSLWIGDANNPSIVRPRGFYSEEEFKDNSILGPYQTLLNSLNEKELDRYKSFIRSNFYFNGSDQLEHIACPLEILINEEAITTYYKARFTLTEAFNSLRGSIPSTTFNKFRQACEFDQGDISGEFVVDLQYPGTSAALRALEEMGGIPAKEQLLQAAREIVLTERENSYYPQAAAKVLAEIGSISDLPLLILKSTEPFNENNGEPFSLLLRPDKETGEQGALSLFLRRFQQQQLSALFSDQCARSFFDEFFKHKNYFQDYIIDIGRESREEQRENGVKFPTSYRQYVESLARAGLSGDDLGIQILSAKSLVCINQRLEQETIDLLFKLSSKLPEALIDKIAVSQLKMNFDDLSPLIVGALNNEPDKQRLWERVALVLSQRGEISQTDKKRIATLLKCESKDLDMLGEVVKTASKSFLKEMRFERYYRKDRAEQIKSNLEKLIKFFKDRNRYQLYKSLSSYGYKLKEEDFSVLAFIAKDQIYTKTFLNSFEKYKDHPLVEKYQFPKEFELEKLNSAWRKKACLPVYAYLLRDSLGENSSLLARYSNALSISGVTEEIAGEACYLTAAVESCEYGKKIDTADSGQFAKKLSALLLTLKDHRIKISDHHWSNILSAAAKDPKILEYIVINLSSGIGVLKTKLRNELSDQPSIYDWEANKLLYNILCLEPAIYKQALSNVAPAALICVIANDILSANKKEIINKLISDPTNCNAVASDKILRKWLYENKGEIHYLLAEILALPKIHKKDLKTLPILTKILNQREIYSESNVARELRSGRFSSFQELNDAVIKALREYCNAQYPFMDFDNHPDPVRLMEELAKFNVPYLMLSGRLKDDEERLYLYLASAAELLGIERQFWSNDPKALQLLEDKFATFLDEEEQKNVSELLNSKLQTTREHSVLKRFKSRSIIEWNNGEVLYQQEIGLSSIKDRAISVQRLLDSCISGHLSDQTKELIDFKNGSTRLGELARRWQDSNKIDRAEIEAEQRALNFWKPFRTLANSSMPALEIAEDKEIPKLLSAIMVSVRQARESLIELENQQQDEFTDQEALRDLEAILYQYGQQEEEKPQTYTYTAERRFSEALLATTGQCFDYRTGCNAKHNLGWLDGVSEMVVGRDENGTPQVNALLYCALINKTGNKYGTPALVLDTIYSPTSLLNRDKDNGMIGYAIERAQKMGVTLVLPQNTVGTDQETVQFLKMYDPLVKKGKIVLEVAPGVSGSLYRELGAGNIYEADTCKITAFTVNFYPTDK